MGGACSVGLSQKLLNKAPIGFLSPEGNHISLVQQGYTELFQLYSALYFCQTKKRPIKSRSKGEELWGILTPYGSAKLFFVSFILQEIRLITSLLLRFKT
jgi:hypothetical protein